MAIDKKDRIDTTQGGGDFLDTRDIKKNKEGIKFRMFGNQKMGYSYFQKTDELNDQGKNVIKVVKSKEPCEMVNPTEGYQGATQTLSKVLYSVAWDYGQEKAVVIILDKISIINNILNVEDNKDLAGMNDYDFRITFDDNKTAAEKYQVVRLDKSDLTKDQEKALKDFDKDFDLDKFVAGEEDEKKEDSKSDIPEDF